MRHKLFAHDDETVEHEQRALDLGNVFTLCARRDVVGVADEAGLLFLVAAKQIGYERHRLLSFADILKGRRRMMPHHHILSRYSTSVSFCRRSDIGGNLQCEDFSATVRLRKKKRGETWSRPFRVFVK